MQVAAEACYRAYVNVEWGNLGPDTKSEKLYNFGRVLRKSGRYTDAKEALMRSLAEEEKLSGKNSIKSGRRMAELSATYLELNQFEDGSKYLDAVLPIAAQYTKNEKQFIATLLYFYGKNLKDTQKAKGYHSKMTEFGYSEVDLPCSISCSISCSCSSSYLKTPAKPYTAWLRGTSTWQRNLALLVIVVGWISD